MSLPISFPHLWYPSTSGSRKALMIVLHGRGDSPEGFTWLPSTLQIPELNYLLIQAPDDYYDGYSWYDLPPDQLPGILHSRILLEQLFVELSEEGFKPEQCFLFGFSQGCLMTLEFGSRFPNLLKGYIGISGYCYDVKKLMEEAVRTVIHQGNWLITHGTLDDVLSVQTTREQMQELMNQGFKMDYQEYRKSHTIDENVELPYIRDWILKRI
jgi:phospholipase/carboxylesterase